MPSSIGQPLQRVDGRLKVTGRASYSAEFNLPNVAYAVLVMSSIPKGRITRMETAAAEHVPGVLAVLSHLKKPSLAEDPMKAGGGDPTDRKLNLLQDDRVYYANQPIAMAVADSFEAAQEAAGLVKVSYAVEPHAVTLEHGMKDAFIPEKMGGGDDPGQSKRGDIMTGMGQAATKLTNIYTTPFQAHNPMEPHATIAVWEGLDKLTVYDATQGIFHTRKRLAGFFALAPENVRVISLYLGGGFGSKGPTWSNTVLAAIAARHVQRPVKLVLARRQMFGPIGFRSETRQEISAGAKADGTLTALSNETYCHTSSFDDFVETATLPTRMLYSTPNNVTVQRVVRSDIGTPSFMRAPGECPGTAALEIFMDEMAYALKMDPIEFRLKNYAEQDEEKKIPWSTKSLRECYRQGADKFGWSKRNPQPKSMRGDGGNRHTLIGMGMATSIYPARRNASAAKARMNADGSVIVEAGTQDLGTGTYTTMTQIAADALDIPPSRVTMRLGDTRYPETPVSGGSMTSASTGSAVDLACDALKKKLRGMPGATAGEPLEAIVKRSGQPFIEAFVDAKPDPGDRKKYSMYAFGAQFAEVHVDEDLGQIQVKRMVGVFAPGRILNARTARSQLLGGMVWATSFALYEHMVYDERLGRVVNNNLAEYHVPTNADIGKYEAYWVDEDDRKVSTMGAKGLGEIGNTGGMAAIANAVFHATGKRVRDFPITLDKLLL